MFNVKRKLLIRIFSLLVISLAPPPLPRPSTVPPKGNHAIVTTTTEFEERKTWKQTWFE